MQKKHLIIAVYLIAAAILLTIAVTLLVGRGKDMTALETLASEIENQNKDADKPFCVLVLGRDRAAGLTDVIMLVSFDIANKKINVLQIPRDTYAEYGDSRHNKLNVALASLGSERKLADWLEESLGVKIDGYISLDLDAFCDIVDAVGGVEIELDRSLYYNDPSQGLYIYLAKGKHKLDGKQAENYVRYRAGYVGGDIDRLDAQKGFLAALFRSIKDSINADNALSVASSLIGKVKTDVGLSLSVALGLKAVSIDEGDVLFFTLPGEAAISPKSGASYYVMSKASTQNLLEEYFYGKADTVDGEGIFLCEKYESFVKIYHKNISTDPISADELR